MGSRLTFPMTGPLGKSVLFSCLLLVWMAAQGASQMHCGSSLVKVGDGKVEVLDKCGEPDYREVVSGNHETKREIWVYRFSSSKFVHTLTFSGYQLDDITVESYR